jgi:SpoVK/Ycf46/Vps4 family AAA+-type ATPase
VLGNNYLFQTHVLIPEAPHPGEPLSSAKLYADDSVIQNLLNVQQESLTGEQMFPAQPLRTGLEWDDLVLHEQAREQLNYLFLWLQHHYTLQEDWGFSKYNKQGFKALFHGHSGTGKTLAATLLGKATGMPVYRIDLSAIVSKYIGETEKNLSRLFQKAEYRGWILFFDEADALFGKRTQVQQSHDRYANQEVAFLLQRLETYPGLVILASNLKSNIDEAFLRRFDLVIHFPKPTAEERIALFYKHLPPQLKVTDKDAITQLLLKHELSGANILNIMRYLSLMAIQQKNEGLDGPALQQAIHMELSKEDKLG